MYRLCQLKYVAEFSFEHSVIWCVPNCWVRDFRTLPCLKFIKLCRVFTCIQCRVFKHYTWYIFWRLISVFLSLVYSFRVQSDFVCVFLLIAVRAWRSSDLNELVFSHLLWYVKWRIKTCAKDHTKQSLPNMESSPIL